MAEAKHSIDRTRTEHHDDGTFSVWCSGCDTQIASHARWGVATGAGDDTNTVPLRLEAHRAEVMAEVS